jgi:hypothetical protein
VVEFLFNQPSGTTQGRCVELQIAIAENAKDPGKSQGP